MGSAKIQPRNVLETMAHVGSGFYASKSEEELLAEKFEPMKGFIGGKRSRDEPPVDRRLSKADTCDRPLKRFPRTSTRKSCFALWRRCYH